MQLSEAWLREFVNPSINTEQLVEQITMAGLEVDSVQPAAAEFSGVVVGEVLTVEPHPNADKLRVCTVSAGTDEPLQIVCGASNVRVGLKAPTALVGAELPGDFKIKKSKLRGEISLGMLCSEKELGLADDAAGLMELLPDAPVGADMKDYLALNDYMIEVDLTPNRADCLSVEGIAREVALLNQMDYQAPEHHAVEITHQAILSVINEAPAECPRYLGRLIKNVDPSAQTPLWMQEKLRRSGLRSLGPLVDVTNFILLELGQPLHAFDAAKLSGNIVIRKGQDQEQLSLLNDQTITLNNGALVIADQKQALALAGVMGGSESAVSDSTQDIFLECAFFAPASIMGKAREFGLHTDSSHRFERGVDPYLQHRAIERATALILQIAGGQAGPITEVCEQAHIPVRNAITLRAERISRLLGVTLPNQEVSEILTRLGMQVETQDNTWLVTPPGFRFDISMEADLIEEIGRVYGYNNLPQTSLVMRSELAKASETVTVEARFKDLMVDRDYQEAITYSFVDQAMQEMITPGIESVALQNPISSDMSVMRTTIWCGLLQAALKNTNRQQHRVRLFETGLTFVKEQGKLLQRKKIAGLALGHVFPEQWGQKSRKIDFFDIKSDVESLCALTRSAVNYTAAKHAALHPGQSAKISFADGEVIGWIGMLHPTLEKQLGFDQQVFLFELDMESLQARQVPSFKPLSKFPSVKRDLALIVDEAVSSAEIIACIEKTELSEIQEVVIFDIYRGQGVAEKQKSVALSLMLQDPGQTLTDSQIDAIVNKVLDMLSNNLNAKLRD